MKSAHMAFVLHSQLAADCFTVAELPLCQLLLMNDSNYPWFILVPRRDGLREIHDMNTDDQRQFLLESVWLSRTMQCEFNALKMNIAALGNVVPQLHIHHIARFAQDAAWPAPVWGKIPKVLYTPENAQQIIVRWQHLALSIM